MSSILSNKADVDEPKYITMSRYKRRFNKLIRDILHFNTIIDAFQATTQAETILATNSALPLQGSPNQQLHHLLGPLLQPTKQPDMQLLPAANVLITFSVATGVLTAQQRR